MMNFYSPNSSDNCDHGWGAAVSLQEMFARYHPRLTMMVEFRIDRRIRARVDACDVVQDAFLDAARRFDEYQLEPKLPPYIWLRFLTLQQLMLVHRKHLGVKARSAMSEQPIDLIRAFSVESDSLADHLLSAESSPSVKALRNESAEILRIAIDQMEDMDREILVLRHFEQLEFSEIAETVGLSCDAVSSRYRRALKKIGALIAGENHIGIRAQP